LEKNFGQDFQDQPWITPETHGNSQRPASIQAVLTADFDELDLNLVTLSANLNLTIRVKASGAGLKYFGRKVKGGQALTLLVLQLGYNFHHATPMDKIRILKMQIIA
jgi:hypothetical protein